MIAPCVSEIGIVIKQWGKNGQCSNEKSKKKLGMKYIPLSQTVVEMGYSLIEQGFVPDKINKKS